MGKSSLSETAEVVGRSPPRRLSRLYLISIILGVTLVAFIGWFVWRVLFVQGIFNLPNIVNSSSVNARLDGSRYADGIAFDDPNWAKRNPHPKDFLGKWSGKWDFTWTVQITISQEPNSDRFEILYEWQEHVGEPLRQGHTKAVLSESSLRIGGSKDSIEMTLSARDPNRAKAFGNYAQPRATDLVRIPSKSASPN